MFLSQRSNFLWLNVKEGSLHDSRNNMKYPGLRGIIKGIRIHLDSFDGKPITKLEILMQNPADVDGGRNQSIVIAGTLYNDNGAVVVWARMFVQRIADPSNELSPTDLLDITVSSGGRATTCFVNKIPPEDATNPSARGTALNYLDVAKDDPTACRQAIDSLLENIIATYGTFGTADKQVQPVNDSETTNDLPF